MQGFCLQGVYAICSPLSSSKPPHQHTHVCAHTHYTGFSCKHLGPCMQVFLTTSPDLKFLGNQFPGDQHSSHLVQCDKSNTVERYPSFPALTWHNSSTCTQFLQGPLQDWSPQVTWSPMHLVLAFFLPCVISPLSSWSFLESLSK